MRKQNGVPEPNYTQTPNALYALMADMSDCELRVTLAICRKTFGWHKDEDRISLSQLEKATGLSRQGVIDGIAQGIERGTISRATAGQSFAYSLIVNEVDQAETSQRSRPELVNVVDQLEPKLVNVVDTQKKGIKKGKKAPPKTTDAEQSSISPLKEKEVVNLHKAVAAAVIEVCAIDPKVLGARETADLAQHVEPLFGSDTTPTPDLVRQIYGAEQGWWYTDDWRGKRGDRPTPRQIHDTWGQWTKERVKAKVNGNGRTNLAPQQYQTEADYERRLQQSPEYRH